MMSMSTSPRIAGYLEDSQAFLMSAPPPTTASTVSEQNTAEQSAVQPVNKSEPQAITKFDKQNIVNNRSRSDSGLLPDWTTSPPFSCTSGFLPNFGASGDENFIINDNFDDDDDKTPMNSFKGDCLLENFINLPFSNASSCRDSGTESVDAFDSADDCSNLLSSQNHIVNRKVLNFFATDKSKSSAVFTGRRQTKFVPEESMKNSSDEHVDTGDKHEDNDDIVNSDGESTLSESSLSPSNDDDIQQITPELVVAAIDKKIKEQKQLIKNKKKKKSRQRILGVTKDDIAGDDEDSDNDDNVQTSPTSGSNKSSASSNESLPDCTKDNLLPIVEVEESSTDEEFGEAGRIPLIRSTSLKTGKTPPGTPRTKKFVRFADAMGLDLESIRTIADDVPYIPPVAAFKGLALEDDDIKWIYGQRSSATLTTTSSNGQCLNVQSQSSVSALGMSGGHLSPTNSRPALRMLFCQPISDPGPFMERVKNFKICLENCIVSGPNGPTDMFDLTCVIRVANLGFEKSVSLRYTTNEWLTWTDIVASYVPHSCDGFSDKFTCMFHIAVNSNGHQSMMPGQRLLFAVRYLANGTDEFWDNNMGLNYALIYQRT